MFDNYVDPGKSSWKRRTLFIGSIGAHVVAAVGLLIYSVLHVEELPPPEVTLTFFNAPPPPPPPPPPPAGAQQQRKRTVKPKVVVPTKTAFVQPKKEEKEEPAEKPEPAGGVAGGVVGGVAGGTVGGVVGAPPPTTPPPPPPPPPTPTAVAPKMVPSFVFDKERISAPDPHLPEDFTNRHPKQTLQGTYRICVGTDGHITEASVVSGIPGLDDVITGQIRRSWLYKPQPLPVCSHRVFVFKIN